MYLQIQLILVRVQYVIKLQHILLAILVYS